ncbi:antigen WC1.1-like [Lepisosteus oculatus]|uniref:antigen WC1.1-like n=1 Tax=Lepisosteus oculatus TaxID=7918 RepID=UPI0035F510CB
MDCRCSGDESHLVNCSSPQTVNCNTGQDVALLCSAQRSLRLVGAGDDCAGRLEVYHNGSWGTVCDDSWDLADSQVVCRQLQCGTALSAPVPASFSQGTGPIWLDEVACLGNESSLWECPSARWGQHDCGHKEDVRILCSDHTLLRLSAGCSGQAEVYYNGTWGSVCQNGMTDSTAAVICKQLGCGDKGTISEINSRLSPDPRWLDFVSCRKHDSTLWQCPSFPWGQNDCTDREVADITCSVPLALRLGGGTNCSGRVELRYEGTWGTVCDDSWDLQDAQVVCRQLGCGDAVSAAIEASFGPGIATIWLDEVNCTGSELHLWDCCHSGLNQSDCRHKEDAGVTCTGVRLVGGSDLCSGRVELQHGETWGSVCDSDFERQDAEVVCRQLDCGAPSQVLKGNPIGKGEANFHSEVLHCHGYTGFRLVNGSDSCSGRVELQWLFRDWGTVCDLYWDLRDTTVLCQQLGCFPSSTVPSSETPDQISLRLVGAGSNCAGRLEVYHSGSWGTVCDDSWDLADSQVVCRQLQCGTALSATVPASFSQGTGPIWLDKLGCGNKGTIRETNSRLSPDPKWLDFVSCRKHDSTLWQCPSPTWGQNDCEDREVAEITCSVPLALRLAGGTNCSGRVELQYEGSWGTICDDSWDLQDAQVVCRQLGCGDAVSAAIEASFGPGSGAIWLDEVNCSGSELHLWDCCHSGLNQSDCRHKEDAGVTCTGSTRTTPQTQPLGGLSVSPLALLLMGALLFVVLALLVRQLIQNRKLRKALSEGALAPYHDAVYEEIEYKLAREGTYSAPRRDEWRECSGRFFSDELPSGYDDVEDSEGDPVPEESIPSLKEEAPEYYDDAVTVPQSPDALSGELMSSVKEEAPDHYDDVIAVPQSPDTVSGVPHTGPGVDRVLPTLPSEEGAHAPDKTDYDDVGDESQGEDGCCETDRAVWEKLLLQV